MAGGSSDGWHPESSSRCDVRAWDQGDTRYAFTIQTRLVNLIIDVRVGLSDSYRVRRREARMVLKGTAMQERARRFVIRRFLYLEAGG